MGQGGTIQEEEETADSKVRLNIIVLALCLDRVSLSGWPGTHRDSLPVASQVLGIIICKIKNFDHSVNCENRTTDNDKEQWQNREDPLTEQGPWEERKVLQDSPMYQGPPRSSQSARGAVSTNKRVTQTPVLRAHYATEWRTQLAWLPRTMSVAAPILHSCCLRQQLGSSPTRSLMRLFCLFCINEQMNLPVFTPRDRNFKEV